MKLGLVVRCTVIAILSAVVASCVNHKKTEAPATTQSTRTENLAGYEFVRIPAGEGVAAFEVGKFEVTVGQFRRFVHATGYRTFAEKIGSSAGFTGTEYGGYVAGLNWRYGMSLQEKAQDNHPVANVALEDVRAFCQWVGGRLPSEKEWEHAARGGLKRKKYVWGNEWPPPPASGNFSDMSAKRKYPYWRRWSMEDYDDGYVNTSPVGVFKPNGYGLFDMAGNVSELLDLDRDPAVFLCSCRGSSFCSWSERELSVTAICPSCREPQSDIGFRVARTLL